MNKIVKPRKIVQKCCEFGCDQEVAADDNFRCMKHSRAYYEPWLKHKFTVDKTATAELLDTCFVECE